MSVLKSRRGESKAEFINTASKIFTETLWFLSRLSARYSRLLTQQTVQLANDVISYSMKANSMLPSDEARYEERKVYLLRARASLYALDYQMCRVYEILLLNPEGAFSNHLRSGEAIRRLDKMAESLGCSIDDEIRLLNGVMKSDRESFLKKQHK